MDSVEVMYNPIAVLRLTNFFDVNTTDEGLKEAAWDQIDKVNRQAKASLQELADSATKQKIDISIAAPLIILPFTQNNDIQAECWVFNLGNLEVKTDDAIFDPNSEEGKMYDMYNINLKEIRMQYFPSIQFWQQYCKHIDDSKDIKELTEGKEQIFNLIEDFSVLVKIHMMRAEVTHIIKDKPRMIVDA